MSLEPPSDPTSNAGHVSAFAMPMMASQQPLQGMPRQMVPKTDSMMELSAMAEAGEAEGDLSVPRDPGFSPPPVLKNRAVQDATGAVCLDSGPAGSPKGGLYVVSLKSGAASPTYECATTSNGISFDTMMSEADGFSPTMRHPGGTGGDSLFPDMPPSSANDLQPMAHPQHDLQLGGDMAVPPAQQLE